MNVTVELFCDCIGRIAVQKGFQLRLLFYRSWQFSYILQIGRCYGVGDEDRFNAGKIETVDIGNRIGFCIRRRRLRLFAARLTIKGKRFPGEFIIVPVKFTRTEV